jgi:hypothetical protein
MWVMTTSGFYSAVQDRDDHTMLIVRSRTKEDADALADLINGSVRPQLHVTVERTPDADYAYRVRVPKPAFAWVLWQAAEGIDYPNFKEAVALRQGEQRAMAYLAVWARLRSLQTR